MQYIVILMVWLCLAETKGNPKLLFANRKDIRVINFQRGKVFKSILVKDVNDAASVDYYYKKQEVCWTDIGNEFIKCVSLNGTNEKSNLHEIKVISRGITSPDGMAIDWLTEKIYWADSEVDRIEVAELYGSNRKVLYWKELDQPRAIALVPSEGFMFWSDWGENPKLERAGMNGDQSTRKVIVDEDILWPNGLTVDYESKKLFWADGKCYSISAVDFDGSRRVKVVDDLKHPFALTYFDHTLYWTDWRTEAIHYCDLNDETRCEKEKQLSLKLSPMYIHVYDQSRQRPFPTACHLHNGGCSHLCLLAPPPANFTCACPTGVNLVNPLTCDIGPQEMLLLARRSDLRRISLDTPDRTPVVLPVANVRHAIAVDYDPVDKFFYWTDDEAFLIQRAKLDGSEQEVLIQSDGLDSDGVAIDWLARNLYWSDAKNNRIEVALLDGSSRKILLRGGLDEPRAIALYPEGGLMFWTDWGNQSKIERSFLDGSNRVTIAHTNLGWPNGVAVDREELKVYWVDARTQVIEVAELDGKGRRVILGENLPHVFGFSLLGDFLYWTDWQKRSIERVHKHNETYREVLVDQLPDVMGLKALSVNEALGYSPCMENNGGCSHLCFNRPGGNYVCDCPLEFELDVDGRKCVTPKAFLGFAQKGVISRASLATFAVTALPMPNVKQPTAIDFDGLGRLYWCDLETKTIYRSFTNGTQPEVVVEYGLSYPEGLAVDWVTDNLYWSDVANNRIEVAKQNGAWRRVILWNVTSPKSLAIDPIGGFIYWSEWSKGAEKIMRAFLDGSGVLPIVLSGVGRAKDLTLDPEEGRLFWLDMDKRTVESADFDGQNRKVIVSDLKQPTSFALYDDFIFWFDASTRSIERARKSSGLDTTTVEAGLKSVTDVFIFRSSRPLPGNRNQNPCVTLNGNCSHLCLHLPTHESFSCACPTHFSLSEDTETCSSPSSFLIFSQKSSLTRLSTDSSQFPIVVLPIAGTRNVQSLAFDPVSDLLFWIDSRSQVIRKASQTGAKSGVLVKEDGSQPVDLVVDPTGGLVLWSCAFHDVINASGIDGTQVGTILGADDNTKPRSLGLHIGLKILFFTNDVIPPTIEKFVLGSLNREVVIREGLKSPTALAVDSADGILFWVDVSPATIHTANMNGQNRKILLDSQLHPRIRLAVHEKYLYWIDPEAKTVEKINKFTGQERQRVLSRVSHLTDIIAVTPHLYKYVSSHPCLKEGKKCSHVCVGNPPAESTHKYSFLMPMESLVSYREDFGSEFSKDTGASFHCACPVGMVLSQNGIACIPKPVCPPKQFTCLSAQNCIPMQWRCDGLKECSDGSDELNCSPLTCDPAFFRCNNGECIETAHVCDRTSHCSDGSDEFECCPPGEAFCGPTRQCTPCSAPERCPESMGQCPFPITHLPGSESGGSKAPYIVGVFACAVALVCFAGAAFYYRRRPSLLDEGGTEPQVLKEARSRQYRVLLSGGKVYTGMRGEVFPPPHPTTCMHSPHGRNVVGAGGPDLCGNVVNVAGGRGGFVERTPATGASSSSSSMTHYPRETMNPPPTPVAEPHAHCQEPHCCYPAHAAAPTALNSYRHYKTHNRPPPPTPCSTDACDDSDFYSSVVASPPFSPPSTSCYSSPPPTDYDSDPFPPPPTPLTTSCPPSPSTDRSCFIHAPCPTPLSNSLSD